MKRRKADRGLSTAGMRAKYGARIESAWERGETLEEIGAPLRLGAQAVRSTLVARGWRVCKAPWEKRCGKCRDLLGRREFRRVRSGRLSAYCKACEAAVARREASACKS